MSTAMTKQERESFLADLHVGIISVAEDGRGPLTVPIWYSYEPGGEVRVVTGGTSRKAQLLRTARRFSLCAQTETSPYKYVSVEGPIVAIEPANLERDRRPVLRQNRVRIAQRIVRALLTGPKQLEIGRRKGCGPSSGPAGLRR